MPKLLNLKSRKGFFVGHEIRGILFDQQSENLLTYDELLIWNTYQKDVGFFGNSDLILTLVRAYEQMGCKMSLKLYILLSRLDLFPENVGAVIDDHGERFHQQVSTMVLPYQGNGL